MPRGSVGIVTLAVLLVWAAREHPSPGTVCPSFATTTIVATERGGMPGASQQIVHLESGS
jgi:hypothetical protein